MKIGDRRGKSTRAVQRTHNLPARYNNAVRQTHTVIILAEKRRLMNHTGTRVLGNVTVAQDPKRGGFHVFKVGEQRFVGFAFEFDARHFLQNFVLVRFFVEFRDTRLHDNVDFLRFHILVEIGNLNDLNS